MNPTVTFIVPCYKFAHLLPECIHSILGQSYTDLEIIIMDDCSPDDTPQVAQSFDDPRVRYVRNEPNLGHLKNYNKGLGLARGKYIWLISADDRLRRMDALKLYVDLLDAHPEVGYVFCPGMSLQDGKETELLKYTCHGEKDAIFDGHRFIPMALRESGIVAASVMARKECYDRLGGYPLNMPHQADIYLWCKFALHYKVGYFAEPMVNYRLHSTSMMQTFFRESPVSIVEDELRVLWGIKGEAEELGLAELARECRELIAARYSFYVQSGIAKDHVLALTVAECEESVGRTAKNRRERGLILAAVYTRIGDLRYWHDDSREALQWYGRALAEDRYRPAAWVKYGLLRFGWAGRALRSFRKSAMQVYKRAISA